MVLADPNSAGRRRGVHRRTVFGLFPLLVLGAVVGAVVLARSNPRLLFAFLFVAAAVIPLAWITVSALWPAKADRKCPRCAADALERLDLRATHGLACRSCGWRDETASAWLLAEEDGPLEAIVLEQRRRPFSGAGRTAVLTTSDAPRPFPSVETEAGGHLGQWTHRPKGARKPERP